jgi:predicted dehydrogenase
MTDVPKYVVAGRGRWAARMQAILSADHRLIASVEETRQGLMEDLAVYRQGLSATFKASGAQIAWLCVPPGGHISSIIQAAMEAGLHVIVEKPWFCSSEETHRLQALGKNYGRVLAIHYEFCLLQEVQRWRKLWSGGAGLSFGGRMHVNRANHLAIPPLDNLGSHLFSIHQYCVPQSSITEIDCAYEQPDERCVWLAQGNKRIAHIDLLAHQEPIIQRFFARVEAAIRGDEFPFDLSFALTVAEQTALWRREARHQTHP